MKPANVVAVLVLASGLLLAQEPSGGRVDRPSGERAESGPHWDVLPNRATDRRIVGFEALAADGRRSFVPVLRDLLRFAETAEEWYRILDAGSAILGRNLRAVEGPWRSLTLEMAGDPSFPELEDYAAWKAELYAQQVDPRMRRFFELPSTATIALHEIVWGGVEVDGIPALDDPATVSGKHAAWLDDAEPVFGLSLGGEQRAYPLRILDWHEMANDRLGGVSFALAYCTLCGAGIVYRTDRDGGRLIFGSSGLLMRSNKLMFDRGTDSLWNQFTGQPVLGAAVGVEPGLEVLPSVVTSWGSWRRQHPDTDVVSRRTGFDRRYELGAAYGSYFGSETMMFPASRASTGRFPKERVFVVRDRDADVAVPVKRVRDEGVVRVHVAGRSVLVVSMDRLRDWVVPESFTAAIAKAGGVLPANTSEWSVELLGLALESDPRVVADLDANFFLGLPESLRLPWLAKLSAPVEAGVPRIAEELRDAIALRGLAAEIRAYEGSVELVRRFDADGAVRLFGPGGSEWTPNEDTLDGPADRSLPRVAGHLAFAFGVEAFLPGAFGPTELGIEPRRR